MIEKVINHWPHWVQRTLLALIFSLVASSLAAAAVESDEPVAEPSAAPVLMVLGDSLSAAYGIPRSEGWVHLLQQHLQAEKFPLAVVNASISGDTSSGGLARLDSHLKSAQPDWVLIELGGNDGLQGVMPTLLKKNLTAMIRKIRDAGAKPILVEISIPPNYGRAYVSRFEQAYADVAEAQGVPLIPFFLRDVATQPALMQADRIHPTAAAQPQIMAFMWKHLEPIVQAESP